MTAWDAADGRAAPATCAVSTLSTNCSGVAHCWARACGRVCWLSSTDEEQWRGESTPKGGEQTASLIW